MGFLEVKPEILRTFLEKFRKDFWAIVRDFCGWAYGTQLLGHPLFHPFSVVRLTQFFAFSKTNLFTRKVMT